MVVVAAAAAAPAFNRIEPVGKINIPPALVASSLRFPVKEVMKSHNGIAQRILRPPVAEGSQNKMKPSLKRSTAL